jgi:hypothetical protein
LRALSWTLDENDDEGILTALVQILAEFVLANQMGVSEPNPYGVHTAAVIPGQIMPVLYEFEQEQSCILALAIGDGLGVALCAECQVGLATAHMRGREAGE